MTQLYSKIFRLTGRWALYVLLFIFPFFLLPFTQDAFNYSKQLLIIALLAVSLIAWVINMFAEGGVRLPRGVIFVLLFFFLALMVVSTIFSISPHSSLGLVHFHSLALMPILLGICAAFLMALWFEKDEVERLIRIVLAGIAVYIVLGILAGFAVFVPASFVSLLSVVFLGILGVCAVLGHFLGLIDLKLPSFFLFLFFALYLAPLILFSFFWGWVALGIVTLLLLVFGASNMVGLRIVPYILFIACIAFFLIARPNFNVVGLDYFGVKPSFTSTLSLGAAVYGESGKNALIGTGPATFQNAWLRFRDVSINQTLFWDQTFTNGYGYFEGALVMIGIGGTVLFLLLLFWALYVSFSRYFSEGLLYRPYIFIGSSLLFFLISGFFINFDFPLVFSLFLFLGFAAVAAKGEMYISFRESSVGAASAVIAAICIFLSTFLGVYYAGVRYAAAVYFNKAIEVFNRSSDFEQARAYFLRAASRAADDAYFRSAAELNNVKIQALLAARSDAPNTRAAEELAGIAQSGLSFANQAIQLAPRDARNWAVRAYLAESLIGVAADADMLAIDSIQKANELDTVTPIYRVDLARIIVKVYAVKRDASLYSVSDALRAIDAAVGLKADYIPAYQLRSGIFESQNNIEAAVAVYDQLMGIIGSAPNVLYEKGLVYYRNRYYSEARDTFAIAVNANASYRDALVMLGLTYEKLADTSSALMYMRRAQQLYPDNKDISAKVRELENVLSK